MLCTERTVKPYLYHTDLCAVFVKIVNRFLNRVANAAHCNDNMLCVSRAVVVEQLVIRSDFFVYLVHVIKADFGNGVVIFIVCFLCLEENIGILRRAALRRVLGIQAAAPESVNRVKIKHIRKLLVVPAFNLLIFVRCSEAIEEMQKGNARFNRCQMSNRSEIHSLLRVNRAKHCISRLPAGINILMIAENRKCVRRKCACRNIDNRRQKLTGNFVHVRNHQQKSLRSRVGCCERACRERAVNSAGGAALGLHLGNFNGSSENILFALSRPLICYLSHC